MDAATRIHQLRERAKHQPLVVLVWGPGDPGPDGEPQHTRYWQKRNQIRDLLAREFRQSEILFSESDALRDYTRDLETLLTEELVHAAIADCILVLDVSRGAHVEVDRISSYPLLAKKMRILLPEKYARGSGPYSNVLQGLRVVPFTEEEFERSSLASVKAIKLVESVALEKLMDSGGVPRF